MIHKIKANATKEIYMKKVILGLLASFMLVGCSGNDEKLASVEAKLVVQKSLAGLTLNDQHGKAHTLSSDTKSVIFAFSKDMGHLCNDFFVTKDVEYLANNKAVFVADVSSAPSIIRSMFIMPGLQDFDHRVLVLDDENTAQSYKTGVDALKIVVVNLENNIITNITAANTINELRAQIEK